jgi:zinc protease
MFSISYEKLTLSNGLEVVLHQDHSLPIVAVNVWYHVGSKDEELGRTGFAHLFEHVMFEGSKHHNRNYFEPLQKAGAVLNGSTTSDRTNYWENVPSNYLDLALWLEADRMGFLLDALDQERFDIQRDIVKNERRQSYENRPYGLAQLLLQPAIFPSPHPYSWPVIGSQQDLDSASLEDVKDFFRRYYSPSNASLAIAGDFERDEAVRLIELYFGGVAPGPAVNRVGRMDSPLTGEVRLTVSDMVQLPRLYLVWPSRPTFDQDEPPLDMLATILGDGKSSRLYRTLVYEKQIARDVRVGNYSQEVAGEFHIEVTASPGHTLEENQEVVEEELERIRREPPSDHEIDRARTRIESQHVHQLERFGGFGGRADQLNYYNVLAKDPGLINTDIERYLVVGGEDVTRVAASVLNADRVRMAVLPQQATSPSASDVDRSIMPKGSAPRPYVPPVPRRERLANGLDLLYVHKPGLPAVAMGLLLKAGATTDPADRPGLADLTATMLVEGTTTRSSQQIADEMESMGSYLDSQGKREHAFLSADTLTSHWLKALEIMADVLKDATFPDRELERVRNERLADLKRVVDDPVSIAHRASRALVYGPGSRYGHPLTGTEQSVKALTRDEMVGHSTSYYGPANATLIVVGDATWDDVLAGAEAHLGDWSRSVHGGPTDETVVEDRTAVPTTIYLADKPGASQSVIRAGHLTIPRHDPDYYSLNMLNYIFGGHPMARLFMNLRQDKGYSYGYYSSIDWLAGPSALFAGGAVETAVTKESVIETLKEFSDIRGDRPVTQEEFDAARDGIFKGFPSNFETQGHLVNQLSRLAIFGLPDDYYSSFIANLEAVTLEELRRVAVERIADAHLMVLVVGDREVIEPGLSELGLPIVPVDYEGRQV